MLHGTKVTELSRLRGMPLTWLNFSATKVSDLSPLRGMPLTSLDVHETPVFNLTPLRDCKALESLIVTGTKVAPADVAALQKALPNCKIERDGAANVGNGNPPATNPVNAPVPAATEPRSPPSRRSTPHKRRIHQRAWANT